MNKLLLLLVALYCISCSNNKKENNDVNNAVKTGVKFVKELPKVQKEIEEHREKLNSQKITGSFQLTIQGDELKTSDWNSANSAIRFYKQRAVFRLRLTDDNKEYIVVTVNCNDKLFPYTGDKKFAPSMFPVGILTGNYKQEKTDGYIQFNYYNDNTNEKYSSVKGTSTLEKLTDSELKIVFNGEMALGDWRQKKFVPANIVLDIEYNFISDDLREGKK